MFSEFGFLRYATKEANSFWQLEVLHTFISYVNQQCERLPFIDLSTFLNQMETLKTAQIEIPLEKRIGSSNGIQLYSAHGSKGLEFDHVFIIQCMEKEWSADTTDRHPFKLRTLFEAIKGPIQDTEAQSQLMEERRRLFFVAVTRAKKSLTLSYYARKLTDKNDSLSPTQFLGELVPSYFQSKITKESLNKEDLIWAQQQILTKLGEPYIEKSSQDWIEDRIQKFVFSPSSIQSILKCGLTFFYGHIVRVPSSPNEYLSYGNAMHACMRNWLETYTKEQKWLSTAECQQYFEYQMNRMKGSFTEKQFESRLSQGKNILEKLLPIKIQEYRAYDKVYTEMSIQSEVNGVLLKGNIDKLVHEGGLYFISDYKTGKNKNIQEKSRLKAKFKEGDIPSDYWLQVGIYALMVNANRELGITIHKGSIESLTQNEQGKFETTDIYYDISHFELIKDLILRAQKALENQDFLRGCGSKTCQWCEFTKERGMVQLPELETEED
jgi:DNA helicase-2/ATP-dependent DNA helicase PcrA